MYMRLLYNLGLGLDLDLNLNLNPFSTML